MRVSAQPLDSDVYLTVLIREKYLEALEKDQNVSIKQLIAEFIEEHLTKKKPLTSE